MGLQQGLDAIQLIHQVFEQGYQGQLQKKKQATDLENQQQQQKLAQEANSRANEELQLHKDTTAAELKSHLAQLEHLHFQNKVQIMEMLKNGTLPGNTTPTIGSDAMGNQIPDAQGNTYTKQPVTFNGETVDNYQLPGEVAQQQAENQLTLLQKLAPAQAQAAAQQTTAVEQAQEPFRIAATNRGTKAKIAEGAPEIQSREKIASNAQEGENTRAQLNASTTIAGHKIAAEASNYNARANNFMLPEQQDALTKEAQMIAGGAPTKLTGKPLTAITGILANSGQSIPDKKDIDKLNTVPMALDTIGMIRKFNEQYGTDSKLKAYLNGKITETDLPTDIKTALAAINTRAISFSKAFEGTQGIKFTNQDLKLVLNGMVRAGSTEEQNKVLEKNLNKMVAIGTNTALLKYSPEQREHIMTTQGFFNNVPEQSKLGGTLDKQLTINQFLKTGKFTPIYK